MAMGRSEVVQDDLMATWAEMPRSPGRHTFYDRLPRTCFGKPMDGFGRGGMQAVLRAADGRAVASAGTVFPHAHDRLLQGHRQRAGHRVALRETGLAARFPAAVERREGSRSFVAVAHALASAARGARDGVRLGAEARGRARPGEGRADRRRRLDDGGQRRVAHDRAATTAARAIARC